MSKFEKSPEHTIDYIFALLLLSLFAIISFLLISFGARQYQSIADNMSTNYETRTACAYFIEKLNQNNISGSIALTEINGSDALVLTQTINEQDYSTYIYYYDNYLQEITITAGSDFHPADAQKVIELSNLSIEILSGNLLCFTITDTAGDTYPVYISLNSN